MEKFVVIGSNSFSGSHFVALALREGAEVVGISRSPELPEVFLAYKWQDHKRFRFHQLDLNQDLNEIMSVIDSFRPDYVINYAAQGMVAQSWDSPEDWFKTNTVAMINLHDRLRRCEHIKKFVQASTPEVYGSTSGIVKEDAPYNPSTPYAVSKAACDMSLMSFQKTYGFPVSFTRAANVCGPGQQLYRIIPKTIMCILGGEKLPLQGGGTSRRSFIDIGDAADGTLRVARDGGIGEVYHLSTDRQVSIRELVETICDHLGVSFKDSVEIAEARLAQDSAYVLDSGKAKDGLDWVAKIEIDEIIESTVRWVRDNYAELQEQPTSYVHKK